MKKIIIASLALVLASCGPSEEEMRAKEVAEQKAAVERAQREQQLAREQEASRLAQEREVARTNQIREMISKKLNCEWSDYVSTFNELKGKEPEKGRYESRVKYEKRKSSYWKNFSQKRFCDDFNGINYNPDSGYFQSQSLSVEYKFCDDYDLSLRQWCRSHSRKKGGNGEFYTTLELKWAVFFQYRRPGIKSSFPISDREWEILELKFPPEKAEEAHGDLSLAISSEVDVLFSEVNDISLSPKKSIWFNKSTGKVYSVQDVGKR